jgi:hypothetical protein
VLIDHVIDPVEISNAYVNDFAQPAGESGFPPQGVDQVKPVFRDGRAVQQQLIDVDEISATAGSDFLN